jgi:hypothetical protein
MMVPEEWHMAELQQHNWTQALSSLVWPVVEL